MAYTNALLVVHSIHNHLSELATDLELPRVTTHSFRRSRATHLYQTKMTPAAIFKITGHRSVAQLMEYIDIAQMRLPLKLLL